MITSNISYAVNALNQGDLVAIPTEAVDYFVSSSPTIFLLDSNNKIILRPSTVPVLDSWLESNIFK
jgi:tRNA A37 threonylcarbamoyladenosine synthetase subunit TsaC/SUA5/YrdC